LSKGLNCFDRFNQNFYLGSVHERHLHKITKNQPLFPLDHADTSLIPKNLKFLAPKSADICIWCHPHVCKMSAMDKSLDCERFSWTAP